MPQISVIVPVYNTGATLDGCMRSVLCQTMDDFEVLLVDDDSPDGAGVLCDGWAARDSRVKAIHLKNTQPGPSEARNAALDAATGQYITMVDSDDTVEPDLFETLYQAAKNTGAALTICNGCGMAQDGMLTPLPDEERFLADVTLSEEAFWDAFNTPWISQFTGTAHRLYAVSLFEGVRYPVGLLHEDYYILPDLIARCDTIVCLAYTGYHVLRRPGSITATARQEVRLCMSRGDIHRAEYFLSRRWFDRAEGALTDAANFLHQKKAAYDLSKPGHRAEFAAVKAELCRVYAELARQKGSAPLKIKAAALRVGLPVYHAWCGLTNLRKT